MLARAGLTHWSSTCTSEAHEQSHPMLAVISGGLVARSEKRTPVEIHMHLRK